MTTPLPNFATCEIIEVETMENEGLESTNNLGSMWCSQTLEHLGLPGKGSKVKGKFVRMFFLLSFARTSRPASHRCTLVLAPTMGTDS